MASTSSFLPRSSALALAAALLGLASLAHAPLARAQEAHQHGDTAAAGASLAAKAPLFDDLGHYHRVITTASPEAQRYFDQGLALLMAFNLEEAERSFRQAASADPRCAMCWWGVAMSLGPHINFPGQPDRTAAGHVAAESARSALTDVPQGYAPVEFTPVERALVDAITRRFAAIPSYTPEAQLALDRAYAEAMREVSRRFPDDLDVEAFTAEALMNLHPWDQWTADGEAKEDTLEIIARLEKVLAKNPNHPGANHYYIHAVEASPHPEKALAAAERIAGLIPGAAHIVHMPSHVYARIGQWEKSAAANRKAIAVDQAYLEATHAEGFYMMYVAHNYQFLWYSALMEGRSAEALNNARAVVAAAPVEMLRMMPGLDFILGYPQWTLLRFGRYEEVLAEPAPPAEFAFVGGAWHAARGLAYARTGRLDEARAELAACEPILAALPPGAPEGLNSAQSLGTIARGLLGGEIAARGGDLAEAGRQFAAAIAAEDGLRYNEPPDWYVPARVFHGEALLAAGKAAEAERVFTDDLARNPHNGWALAGLAESQRQQGKTANATSSAKELTKAWSHADVPALFSGKR